MIQFTLSVTNQYVNSTAVPVQLSVLGGSPSYIAILVNDTNTADASWQPFTSTNLWVPTPTDGAYVIAVGLCGPAKNATLTWQCVTVVRDTTPLILVLTNLAALSGSRPFIDPAGYATRSLSALSWTLLDANGGMSGGNGAVVAKDWNLPDQFHATNWFQCLDLALALGTNSISIQAVDWAGNVATTNFAYVFDTNGDTTPPALTLLWPQDGTQISGNSFTVQAWMDDDTATAALQYTDSSGILQTMNGLVERGGNMWVEGVPLAAGTNSFSLTATDAAGNVSTTNFSVVQSTVALTVAPLFQDQMQYGYATVIVTVGGSALAVTVNGVAGTSSDGQSWEADNVPLPPGGTVTLQATAQMADGSAAQTLLEEDRQPIVFTQTYSFGLGYSLSNYLSECGGGWTATDDAGLQWARGTSGTQTHTYSEFNPCDGDLATEQIVTVWPADNGYVPSLAGQETDSYYLNGVCWDSFTQAVPPPPVEWVEKSTSSGTWPDNYDATWTEASDRAVKLFTGGKALRQSPGLFDLSAGLSYQDCLDSAVSSWCASYEIGEFLWPDYPPVPVPPEDITLGALGPLGSDGHLWTVQPDGIEIDITPQVLSCRSAHALAASPNVATATDGSLPTQQKYEPVITANGITLDPDSVTNGADFCVGQGITFAIAGAPPRYLGAEAKWTLPGTYVNTNSDPNCDLFYEKNTALLTRLSWRDKTLSTTPCWYVLDAANAQVSVTVTYYFRNEGRSYSFIATGKFNVHRPTATFISPSSIDGTPTVMVANGLLSLGDGNRHNDMSFGHNINPGAFSGQAGYTQLVGDGGDEIQTYLNSIVLIQPVNLLDNLEFPRGQPTTPSNTTTPVQFWDGPSVSLANNDTETLENLHFHTYLLFKPDAGPGPNIFVPLRKVDWSLDDDATYGPSGWTATGSASDPSDVDSNSFPDWIGTLYNSQFVW